MTAPTPEALAAARDAWMSLLPNKHDEFFGPAERDRLAAALDAFAAAQNAELLEKFDAISHACLAAGLKEGGLIVPFIAELRAEVGRVKEHRKILRSTAAENVRRAEKAEAALKQSNLLLKAARIGPVKAVLAKSEGQTLMLTKKIADEIDAVLARGAE